MIVCWYWVVWQKFQVPSFHLLLGFSYTGSSLLWTTLLVMLRLCRKMPLMQQWDGRSTAYILSMLLLSASDLITNYGGWFVLSFSHDHLIQWGMQLPSASLHRNTLLLNINETVNHLWMEWNWHRHEGSWAIANSKMQDFRSIPLIMEILINRIPISSCRLHKIFYSSLIWVGCFPLLMMFFCTGVHSHDLVWEFCCYYSFI